jgi:hypothetical protein
MRFSVWPNPERPVSETSTWPAGPTRPAGTAIWFADHYMPNTEDGSVSRRRRCTSAGPCCPRSPRSPSGSGSGRWSPPTSVHHPALLANRAASIDHVSGGRFVLGSVRAGRSTSTRLRHRAARAQGARRPVRRGDPDHPLDARRWSHHGRGRPTTASSTRPATRARCSRLPLLVGSGRPRMLGSRPATRTSGTPGATPRWPGNGRRNLRCRLRGGGPRPEHDAHVGQALVFLTDDDADGRQDARRRPGRPHDRRHPGPQLIDVLGEYVELGFDEFIVPDFTLSAARRAAYRGRPAFDPPDRSR